MQAIGENLTPDGTKGYHRSPQRRALQIIKFIAQMIELQLQTLNLVWVRHLLGFKKSKVAKIRI